MKKVLVMAGLILALNLGADEYKIDAAHSSVGFKVKHLLVSTVGGKFKDFNGKIDLDPANKKINFFEGEIAIDSVDTDNQKRDDHLKSPDFFDAKKNPKGYFKMTKQEEDKLYGILTFGSVSREVVFDVDISDIIVHPKTKKNTAAIDLEGKINRKDFEIGSGVPNTVVGDEVKITINLELTGQ